MPAPGNGVAGLVPGTFIESRRGCTMRRALAVGLVQAVWVAGLVAGGGGFAAPAAAQENPFTTSVDVRMGERLFRAQCGRCHGRDATGNDETGAPDLTT